MTNWGLQGRERHPHRDHTWHPHETSTFWGWEVLVKCQSQWEEKRKVGWQEAIHFLFLILFCASSWQTWSNFPCTDRLVSLLSQCDLFASFNWDTTTLRKKVFFMIEATKAWAQLKIENVSLLTPNRFEIGSSRMEFVSSWITGSSEETMEERSL